MPARARWFAARARRRRARRARARSRAHAVRRQPLLQALCAQFPCATACSRGTSRTGLCTASPRRLFQIFTMLSLLDRIISFRPGQQAVSRDVSVRDRAGCSRARARASRSHDATAVLGAWCALCTPPVLATVAQRHGNGALVAARGVEPGLGRIGDRSRPARAALRTLLVYLCRPDAALIPALAFVIAHCARARIRCCVISRRAARWPRRVPARVSRVLRHGAAAAVLREDIRIQPVRRRHGAARRDRQAHVFDRRLRRSAAPLVYVAAQRMRRPGAAYAPRGRGVRRVPRAHQQRDHGLPCALRHAGVDPARARGCIGVGCVSGSRHSARGAACARADMARAARAWVMRGDTIDPPREGVLSSGSSTRASRSSRIARSLRARAPRCGRTRGLSDVARCAPGRRSGLSLRDRRARVCSCPTVASSTSPV